MRIAATLWTSRVAAMLAVALLSFAGVKSAVMQVQMAVAPAADCGMSSTTGMTMAGMTMAGMAARHAASDAAKAPTPAGKGDCPFCADAANAPLIAYVQPLRPPASTIFVVAAARPPLGARAPPALQPRARGPPSPLQTA